MATALLSTKELEGQRVLAHKKSKKDPEATRRVGKVRSCVFHPKGKRCVGFIVRRPDAALMFHRRDVFVALNGYDLIDGRIVIKDDPSATDKGACKALGINWDDCVLWVGLSVVDSQGTNYGYVGDVLFDAQTGAVESLEVTTGAASNALLGTRIIPASLIRGFKRGIGTQLKMGEGAEEDEEGNVELGAILVDDSAAEIDADGGLAAKAGEATAVVADKAHKAMDAAKPAMNEAAAAAGEAVNKGAYATGRQINRAKGMFSGFAEEYKKASGSDVAEADADAAEPDHLMDGEAGYVDEEGNKVIFLDEDGNQVVYVDEDGNLVDPEDDDIVIEAGSSGSNKAQPVESGSMGKAVGSHLRKAGGMFDAFKEEYDKARHG